MSSPTPLAHDRAVALIRTALDGNWSGYGTLDKSKRLVEFAAAVAHAHHIHASQWHVLRGAFVTAYKPVKRKRGDLPPGSGPLVLNINQRAVSYQDITTYLHKNRDLIKAKPSTIMEDAHSDAQPVAKAQVPTSTSAPSPPQEAQASIPHIGRTCAALEARVLQLEAVVSKVPLLETTILRLEARLNEAPRVETSDSCVATPEEAPPVYEEPEESTPTAPGSPGDETPLRTVRKRHREHREEEVAIVTAVTQEEIPGSPPGAKRTTPCPKEPVLQKQFHQGICEELGIEHDGLSCAEFVSAIKKWGEYNPLRDDGDVVD